MRPRHGRVNTFAIVAVAALLITASGPGTSAAIAAAADHLVIQAEIDAHLAAYPGGKQINANEIAYDGGRFVMTFARSHSSVNAADCPSGWYCFYDGVNYSYPRGKLSDCGWADLSGWGWQNRTESVHYNISTGSTTYIDTGSEPGAQDDVDLFSSGSGSPMDSDVNPFRNMADNTYRFC